MSFAINDMGTSDIEPIEEGSLPAIIQGLVTYGIQPQTDWQTKEPKPSEKRLALTFEFPTEAVEKEQEDGQVVTIPRRLTKEYKVSSHKKSNIMKLIRFVAPGIESLADLLDKPVLVTVGRTSTGKAKVANVAPPMKGIETGSLLNGLASFDFYNPSEDDFKTIAKFQQTVVMGADDYDGFADGWVEQDDF